VGPSGPALFCYLRHGGDCMPETLLDNDMERRVVHETGTDARIAHLVEPLLDTLGFRLVRVRLSSREGLTLQIMLERNLAKVETAHMLDGRKRFKGRIGAVDRDGFMLEAEKAAYGESPEVRIPFEELGEVRLVLTDDLIREALRRDKELRKQAKEFSGNEAD
jgi:ribosome maturation factor RimP